jgi:two-component system, LuxR family, response regulator FixJ
MNDTDTVIYVVDDDDAVRDSLSLLLRTVGLPARTFGSAAEFLDGYEPDKIGCLVADIRMPGLSGLELQAELIERAIDVPIIFITGHGDVPMAVKAMKSGAMDFIQKPFRDQDLLDRINEGLERARSAHESQRETSEIKHRFEALTPREGEVMKMVVKGHANKVIAMDLGVSQRTVELHRARVMQKMGVRSLAELVRLAEKLED